MIKDIELLAPAGTYDSFIAAVENGADAVYLGGKLFNARANASNFDLDELKKIVEYAHLRNVKIHLTMNTLLDDSEIKEALDFAYSIYEIGVDAVIIQDLGLAKILHEHIPDLPLHASTQLSTHNLEGVKKLVDLGFSRVVLARELSFNEIKYICDNTSAEIEIFAHGALCVSYSGQCLMSSMIGDRSGNRGKCAQPCRMPYKLIKNNTEVSSGYLLSPKDLSIIDCLKDLPNVTCLKIEGRMKSPEYVATVVSIYRKYLDKIIKASSSELDVLDYSNKDFSSLNEIYKKDFVSKEDKNNLAQIFNRGDFSTAYLYKKTGKDMMCYEKPKNWGVYVGKVTNYDGKRYITLDDTSKINIGDGIEVWNNSNESPSTIVSELTNNKVGRISGNINIGDKVYKTSDKLLNQKARESFSRGFVRHTLVTLKAVFKTDKPVTIFINDFKYVSDIVPEKSEKQPLTFEKVKEQLIKTGNTPFEVSNIEIELDDDLFLPVSKLNEIRRQAFELYEQKILSSISRKIKRKAIKPLEVSKAKLTTNKEVSVFFNILREEYKDLKNVDNYYFYFRDIVKNIDVLNKFSGKKFIVFPAITKLNYEALIKKYIFKLLNIVDGFVLSNIGQLGYFDFLFNDKEISKEYINSKIKFIANYNFNTFNSYTIELLKELGFSKVILSPELTKAQVNSLANLDIQKEIICYGNICVMTSEYCPVGSIAGGFSEKEKCSKPCIKNDKYYLRDRMNMDFRILPDNINCQSRIFNSKINSIETKDLNVDSIRIDVIDESLEELQKIVDLHKSGGKLSGESYTNGHLNRPV